MATPLSIARKEGFNPPLEFTSKKEQIMLSQQTIDRLNQQINLEIYSSHLYLQMSSWCAYKSLDGCATFLSQHAGQHPALKRRGFVPPS